MTGPVPLPTLQVLSLWKRVGYFIRTRICLERVLNHETLRIFSATW